MTLRCRVAGDGVLVSYLICWRCSGCGNCDGLPGILPGMAVNRMDYFTDIAVRSFKAVQNNYWYPFLTRRLNAEDLTCLNYGYEEDPPMGLPLAASDEPNRLGIQLYHRVASQSDLHGKQVLEVSCGHGGGASYLTRTLHPASYTGLDFNAGRHRVLPTEAQSGRAGFRAW